MSETCVVWRLLNDNEASLVRSLLESYGIPVTISSDRLPHAIYPMNIGEIRIAVPLEFRDEAMRILEAHREKSQAGGVYEMNEAGPEHDPSDRDDPSE